MLILLQFAREFCSGKFSRKLLGDEIWLRFSLFLGPMLGTSLGLLLPKMLGFFSGREKVLFFSGILLGFFARALCSGL